jgi:hypothetical protein
MVKTAASAPQSSTTYTQEYCMPVADDFGTPPDTELMRDPLYHSLVSDAIGLVEVAHSRPNMRTGMTELETGEAAARAVKTLGCCACKLSGTCTVYENLLERSVEGKKNMEFTGKLAMLTAGPAWLTAGRMNLAGISVDKLAEISEGGPEKAKESAATGSFDLDTMLGGVQNEFEGLVTKSSLPELASIQQVDPKAEMESHLLTTKHGDRFRVIDASEAFGFKGHRLTPADSEYQILTGKLLQRMNELDAQSHPQIMTADSNNKMQKVIDRRGSATLFELRMSGKNRLYAFVEPNDPDDLTRIVILGAHGGDAKTQQEFIAAATPSAQS